MHEYEHKQILDIAHILNPKNFSTQTVKKRFFFVFCFYKIYLHIVLVHNVLPVYFIL